MTTFLPGSRIATCALVAWSVYMAAWTVASDARPASVALWWLAGLALLQAIRQAVSQRRQADPVPDREPEGGATVTS